MAVSTAPIRLDQPLEKLQPIAEWSDVWPATVIVNDSLIIDPLFWLWCVSEYVENVFEMI